MGTTYAYDNNLPCKNPNCKSHGRPHPNCKCYGMADGGEVGSYCSEARDHKEGCEYYAGGGEVLPSFDEMKAQAEQTEELPSFDEMKAQSNEPLPSFDEMKAQADQPKPTDTVEQLKAGAEGLAQGLFGDIAKVAQVKTGISTLEDIERREREYPVTHGVTKAGAFAGSMLAGPAKAITAAAGSKMLGNIITAATYALSDNTAKAFLGQPGGDVESVVAGTIIQGGLEGMMNTLTSGLFSAAPKALKAITNENMRKAAENAMISIADKPVNKLLSVSGAVTAAKSLGSTGIVGDLAEYKIVKDAMKPMIEKVIGKPLTKANEYVGDAILNTLSKTDFLGVPAIMKWAERSSGGLKAVSEPVEALFKSGTHSAINQTKKEIEDQIRLWMDEGGIEGEIQRGESPQGFASGGQVATPNRSFESLYPAENIMLNEARGRVSGYLNTLRPINMPSARPFDRPQSQKQKEREYNKAIKLAANPLSILESVNKGSILPEDVKHFKSMWPEVYGHLSKKMTERILKSQLDGEKPPPYKKRQAMSLFLGADLDSSFAPQSIAVVQGMYAAKKQQRQQATQGSKKAIAKSSNSLQTPEQAREKRLQNQK